MMVLRAFVICSMALSTVWCSVVLASAPLPKDALTNEARNQYNNGKYKQALALFIKLAQKYPTEKGVYRALAASANNAKAFHTATKAYEIYLGLNPTKEEADKVKAELSNVRKQAKGKTSARWQSINRVLKTLDLALKNEKLSGSNGAIALLDTLVKRQFFGPKLATYHNDVWRLFQTKQQSLLDTFWHVEKKLDVQMLIELEDAIKNATQAIASKSRLAGAKKSLKALTLYNNGESRDLLAFLERSQLRDYRLRYMMAILLFEQDRAAESIALLHALGEQYRQPRALVRAEQMRLAKLKRIEDEDLDLLVDTLDQLPAQQKITED